jgi:hypothetical protein
VLLHLEGPACCRWVEAVHPVNIADVKVLRPLEFVQVLPYRTVHVGHEFPGVIDRYPSDLAEVFRVT